jgi:pimeloyl-ACP methyl ester carboxylesterase
MTTSVDVGWELDGIAMSGTVVRPDGAGPFPAIVMVAGSGPTDRNWCSPLLPGTNGSAPLLAEAFAAAGYASLRYDKRVSGPHLMDNARQLVGKLSMASHLAELVAAVGVLAGQEFVDETLIVALGNSEGTLHVLHYATTPQEVPLVGIVLAAPPGRPVSDVLMSQLTLQAGQVPGGDELLAMVRAAVDRYRAGEPMDIDPRLPEDVQHVLMSFETPANLPLARELFFTNGSDSLAEVKIPTLVVIGLKDLQVDAHADGDPLQAVAGSNVKFAFPAHANHVLKEETRSTAEVIASPGNGYNADGAKLDPEALQIILDWLQTVLVKQ